MHLKRIDIQGYRAAADQSLTCEFPGRFSLMLGANGAGKTTISEAIAIAHRSRFPQLPMPDAGVLGPPPRSLSVTYEFDAPGDEGALGRSLVAGGYGAPTWSRGLERSLGRVRPTNIEGATQGTDNLRLVYLPATRNPLDELSRREARVLLELLRTAQLRSATRETLATLRARAQAMLETVSTHQLVQDVQGRVADNLRRMSSGVQEHFAFVGTQVVDDAYLARVLELLLATVPDPLSAQKLEASSLGYVNLLHIAVTLAGIPDLSAPVAPPTPGTVAEAQPDLDGASEDESARLRLAEASRESEQDQDSFYPELFHATVVLEEPEAHLHPQLQFGLVRYLRQATIERPDIQMIIATHSGELVAATHPSELVVVRRSGTGVRAIPLAEIPIPEPDRTFQFVQTQLHLDASRSSALFSDRLLLVEGVTEAILLRSLGRAWAAADPGRLAFVDALSILPLGHKVGQWPMQLLAWPGWEIVSRVAGLSDSDRRGAPLPDPVAPGWHAALGPAAKFFWSRPTLEPTLVAGNEDSVSSALTMTRLPVPPTVDASTIDDLFTGTGKPHKANFSLYLAEVFNQDLGSVVVPDQIRAMFDWLSAPGAPESSTSNP